MQSLATKHPVLFVLLAIAAWLVLAMAGAGLSASGLGWPYGDGLAIGRLGATVGCLLLIWRLGWLERSGITRPGHWLAWLAALGTLVCFAGASLHAFHGSVSFDWPLLTRSPAARAATTASVLAALSEEVLFRGLVLCTLSCAWGSSRRGVVGSLVATSLSFAALHATQVATGGLTWTVALLLVAETSVVSFWWGVLVLASGSIWPAVMWHAAGNAVMVVRSLSAPAAAPGVAAYQDLLAFSLPLGICGAGVLAYLLRRRVS